MTSDGTVTADQIAGRNLAELRTAVGLTQAGLAAAAGIDEKVYNALERGRRRISMLYAERLAGPLRVGDQALLLPSADVGDLEDEPLNLHDRLEAIAEGLDRVMKNQEAALRLLRESLAGRDPGRAPRSGKSTGPTAAKRKARGA